VAVNIADTGTMAQFSKSSPADPRFWRTGRWPFLREYLPSLHWVTCVVSAPWVHRVPTAI